MSEQDEQVVPATNDTEEQELEINLDDTEDVEALKAQIAEKDTFARQAVARAKKAEQELKELKGSTKSTATQTLQTNGLSEEAVEVMLLKAQGMELELIEELKTLAKIRGKSVIDTQNDPIFVAIKAAKEAKEKAEKSKLGASRGSNTAKKEKSLQTPGLTEAERKELWKAEQAR